MGAEVDHLFGGLICYRADGPKAEMQRPALTDIVALSADFMKAYAKGDRGALAKLKGVKTTTSGLQYQILIPGDSKAASPKLADTVTVQYRGKLLDGTEFDSSYARNQPATFPVNGVIQGWQEVLPLMKPGSKWKVVVPPELGYGSTPRPGIPGRCGGLGRMAS